MTSADMTSAEPIMPNAVPMPGDVAPSHAPAVDGARDADYDLRHHGDADVDDGLVDLAVNVRHGTPPRWLAERLAASMERLAAYPRQDAAIAAIASRHGRDPAEVVVTAGAAEAFVLLARTLRPRRAVVVHPQFTEPEAALSAAGHHVERVVLPWPYRLDPASVPDTADLVLVGNPTNPTSVCHAAATLARLARPGRTLVVDEAFIDCVPGERESLAARRDLPGLVVIRSLTKTWGLAGLRAGYLLATPELAAALTASQPLWPVSTPALVACEACSDATAVAEADAWARALATDRARLTDALAALPGVRVVPDAAASFLLLRLADPHEPVTGTGARADRHGWHTRGPRVREALRRRGFAVRRGDTFPGLDGSFLRVAVRDRGTTDAFVTELEHILARTT